MDGPGLALAVGRAAAFVRVAAWCRAAALGFADDFGDGVRGVSADVL
ncbi:MAG TPA: hypothetical protein VNW50_14580 [Streptosporangiaceae bacterium]|nr:hypothetical protein [Streptosporangiaceae bacterium]